MLEQVPPGEHIRILLCRNSTATWRINAKILSTCRSGGIATRTACYYYAIVPREGELSDDARLTSVTYIGLKSRTERPRKTKIGTEVAHVTRDSDTTFKVKRVKRSTCTGAGAYCGGLPYSLCGSVAYWLGRCACDQQVVGGMTPGRHAFGYGPRKVIHAPSTVRTVAD